MLPTTRPGGRHQGEFVAMFAEIALELVVSEHQVWALPAQDLGVIQLVKETFQPDW